MSPATAAPALEDRALAAFLGFAIGDALGATVEFLTRGKSSPNMAGTARSSAAAGSI